MSNPSRKKPPSPAPREPIRTYSTVPPPTEAQEQSACVMCNNDAPNPHWQLSNYRFARCSVCGHIYQNPRPTAGALDNRYAEEYFRYELENAEQFFQLMMLGIKDSGVHQLLAPHIDASPIDAPAAHPIDAHPIDAPSAHPSPTNARTSASVSPNLAQDSNTRPAFLDIGCATGMLLAHYQQQGWEAQGIELCHPAAKYAREQRGVAVFSGDYPDAPLPPKHYTLIHSSHVIEHLPDPLHFLRVIARSLRPNGYAIIVTPDAAGLQARLLGARWRSVIADHLNLFRASDLIKLARRAGLTLVRKCSWGGLAAGITAAPLKRIADHLAKRFNIGDVMLLLLQTAEKDDRR